MHRYCPLCIHLPCLSKFFQPRTSATEEVDQDRRELPVEHLLSSTQIVTMAAVNGDRGHSQDGPSAYSTAALKLNNHFAANGESNTPNGVITNGESRPEVSKLTVVNRPYTIEDTSRYQDEFRRINADAFNATTSMKSFFDFVANDRLRRMPHKGSRWDKILRWAEYFAAQVFLYHESVSPFVPNSEETAQLLWASCRILLQVSHWWLVS